MEVQGVTKVTDARPDDKRLYLVIDENGEPCHGASWPESCHEHINDALYGGDIAEAARWRVAHYMPVSQLFEFLGWLSGDIPELHGIETPRLMASWERYKDKTP